MSKIEFGLNLKLSKIEFGLNLKLSKTEFGLNQKLSKIEQKESTIFNVRPKGDSKLKYKLVEDTIGDSL